MRICPFLLILFSPIASSRAQKQLSDTFEKFNNNTVAYVSAEELDSAEDIILLDTRQKKEFDVSHLKHAIWVGYDNFDIDNIHKKAPDKEAPVVVYCSIGVRSEDIGEKLISLGYTNVKNLYGGIFEWKNKGYSVYYTNGAKTEKVHAYSKFWGVLLTNAKKIYSTK
ncbi:MAG: rhodanese-like domain-containing protein [Bacteroidota bacterium]